MQVFKAQQRVFAPAARWQVILLCTLWAPAAQGAGFARESVRALSERTMNLALGRWAKPMFGQHDLEKLRLAYLEFRYSQPDTPHGRKVRGRLSKPQKEFLQQVRQIENVAWPTENWSHPNQVHRSRSRRDGVLRVRKTSQTSWDSGFGIGGRLAWTEQEHRDEDSGKLLERDGRERSERLIKLSGLRVQMDESAFLVIDNGYAPQVLTLNFNGADGELSLRNMQAGAVEGQRPLVEKARLRWRAGDQWEVVSYQRDFRKLGYHQITGSSTAWPTALGSIPIQPGELQSRPTATHYVSYAERGRIGYAEPARMNDAQLAGVELSEIEFVLKAPFSGTLDAMFAGAHATARHQLPGEHEALVLLDTLRRRIR